MLTKINSLNINYTRTGAGPNLLFLHGWSLSGAVFSPLTEKLHDRFTVWAIDLPGFGQSDPPPGPWGNEEYISFLNSFFKSKALEKAVVAGHSFGGALAAMFAHRYPAKVTKLILIDTAGTRKTKLKLIAYRAIASLGKTIFSFPYLKNMKQAARDNFYRYAVKETDYLNSGSLEGTFKKIINRDLNEIYPQIKIPTLIIWGENDKVTPLKEGLKIQQLIPDSQLKIIENAGHHVFLEKPEQFCKILLEFLIPQSQ
ncbi:alpha/beta hydrolase [Patescibacteria group bacterium]|nr:alpha/beta hydrolase [Patescibacteria group bacterium]MBU1868228.1 alpha/beta hydrolase [Patescibacteria group bacterium]